MDIVIAVIIAALCGVVQFLLLRYTLKPLAEGREPRLGKVLLLRIPIPLVLLTTCALINVTLLPYVGGAFCIGSVIASVANHFVTTRRKDDT